MSISIIEAAFLLVFFKKTFGAKPCSYASFHLSAHTHQESPSFRPGKLNSGLGVDRSLPLAFEKLKSHLLLKSRQYADTYQVYLYDKIHL